MSVLLGFGILFSRLIQEISDDGGSYRCLCPSCLFNLFFIEQRWPEARGVLLVIFYRYFVQ